MADDAEYSTARVRRLVRFQREADYQGDLCDILN